MDGVTITRSDRRVLQALIRELPQQADALVRAAATEMTGDIVESFGTQTKAGKMGRDERGRFTKAERLHVPSSPGNPPNVDTGALRASMGWVPDGELRALIHDGVDYGIHLELGTERMAARPFMAPVFEDWRHRKFARLARDLGIFTGRYA